MNQDKIVKPIRLDSAANTAESAPEPDPFTPVDADYYGGKNPPENEFFDLAPQPEVPKESVMYHPAAVNHWRGGPPPEVIALRNRGRDIWPSIPESERAIIRQDVLRESLFAGNEGDSKIRVSGIFTGALADVFRLRCFQEAAERELISIGIAIWDAMDDSGRAALYASSIEQDRIGRQLYAEGERFPELVENRIMRRCFISAARSE